MASADIHTPFDVRLPADVRLRAAVQLADDLADIQRMLAFQMRDDGATWEQIGAAACISKQAAQKRWGHIYEMWSNIRVKSSVR